MTSLKRAGRHHRHLLGARTRAMAPGVNSAQRCRGGRSAASQIIMAVRLAPGKPTRIFLLKRLAFIWRNNKATPRARWKSLCPTADTAPTSPATPNGKRIAPPQFSNVNRHWSISAATTVAPRPRSGLEKVHQRREVLEEICASIIRRCACTIRSLLSSTRTTSKRSITAVTNRCCVKPRVTKPALRRDQIRTLIRYGCANLFFLVLQGTVCEPIRRRAGFVTRGLTQHLFVTAVIDRFEVVRVELSKSESCTRNAG